MKIALLVLHCLVAVLCSIATVLTPTTATQIVYVVLTAVHSAITGIHIASLIYND